MQNSYKHHKYKLREGFSLVEVIIAVTVLAILCIPLLSYFTNASLTASRGKNVQKADFVAETAMEELNALDTFEKLAASPDPGVTAMPEWTVSPAADGSGSVLTRDITVDGFQYHVVANVDYGHYGSDSSGGVDTDGLYNNYAVPQLQEIYSPENVVLEETDQTDTAISDVFYENPARTKSEILDELAKARTLCLDVTAAEEDTGGGTLRDIFWVKPSFRYTYKNSAGTDVAVEKPVKEIKIERNKLKNIYFFYKAIGSTTSENAEVSFHSAAGISAGKEITRDEVEGINVCFVLQNVPSASIDQDKQKRQTDYKLKIKPGTGDTYSGDASYSSNGIELYFNGIRLPEKNAVPRKSGGNRIAKITVDVYEYRDGSSYPDDERLVRLNSSKGV